jgi:hypothetical protein
VGLKGRKKNYLVNFKNRANNKGVRNNPDHFIFFDTETKQDVSDKRIGKKKYKTVNNTLDMGWAVYWNRQTNEKEWFYFETIEEFHTWTHSVIKRSKSKVLWIIAHNIVFDNIIVDMQGLFSKLTYETDFIHTKGMVYLQKLSLKKDTEYLDSTTNTIKQKRVSTKTVMLVNNGNIFPAKLETIGETVNLPKLHVDFEKSSRDYIKVYCKRDVEILLAFWEEWTKFLTNNNLGNIKYTISSQSMEAFKQRFCNNYIVLDDDMKNLEFERLGYYGGRTEIFHKGIVRKPIYYYDVNSMYPHAMKANRFPIEYKFSKDNPSIEYVKYMIDKGYLIMAECNIDTKLNLYPVKDNNTLLFPIGKFKTYLPTPEVLEAFTHDDIVSFGHVSFYRGDFIFSDYVDFFYNKRLELKKAGNKQEAMYKLFLNALYGKFGQMMDSWNTCTVDDVKAIDSNFNLGEWIMDNYKIPKIILMGIDMTPKLRYIGEQLQISTEKEESNISFPAIAAHVTSYARLILARVIKYCQDTNIKKYYCDTDSIFTEEEIASYFLDEKELGKMKLEKYYEHGVEFINLKNYCALDKTGHKQVISVDESGKEEKIILNDETFLKDSKILKGKEWKMKGVPNSAEVIDENNFITQEWGGLPKQEYYKKFGRKVGEFWVIHKHKTNHGKINKGLLKENGDIEPFVRSEKF